MSYRNHVPTFRKIYSASPSWSRSENRLWLPRMKIEALILFETSVSVYHSTRRHNPEGLNLHHYNCQTLGVLTSKTRYWRKDRSKGKGRDDEEEDVSSRWVSLRKRADTDTAFTIIECELRISRYAARPQLLPATVLIAYYALRIGVAYVCVWPD